MVVALLDQLDVVLFDLVGDRLEVEEEAALGEPEVALEDEHGVGRVVVDNGGRLASEELLTPVGDEQVVGGHGRALAQTLELHFDEEDLEAATGLGPDSHLTVALRVVVVRIVGRVDEAVDGVLERLVVGAYVVLGYGRIGEVSGHALVGDHERVGVEVARGAVEAVLESHRLELDQALALAVAEVGEQLRRIRSALVGGGRGGVRGRVGTFVHEIVGVLDLDDEEAKRGALALEVVVDARSIRVRVATRRTVETNPWRSVFNCKKQN